MNTNSKSKTSLFLMEIIIAILFFSIASAICLRLFAGSHQLTEKDRNLSNALLWSQNLSESFTGHEGNIVAIKALYDGAFLSTSDDEGEGTLILFFDEKWNAVDTSLTSASFEAILTTRKDTAAGVYSDVTDYSTALTGNAMVGQIAILDVRGAEDVYSEIPKKSDNLIFQNTIDVYIGDK